MLGTVHSFLSRLKFSSKAKGGLVFLLYCAIAILLRPTQVLADNQSPCCKLGFNPYACDPAKYGGTPIQPGGYTYCVPVEATSTGPCDRVGKYKIDVVCNLTTENCKNNTGPAACVPKQSDPTCKSGSWLPKISPEDYSCLGDKPCCETETLGHGVAGCKMKPGSPTLLGDTCEDVKNYALSLSEKNNCPDLTTKYDSGSKKCLKYKENTWQLNTADCKVGDKTVKGVDTAIGCVPTGELPQFLTFLFKWVLGAAGGVITLMLIFTGYSVLTSSGNPEKLTAAKENMVSIFSGLILIIFSLILLQAVGAGVLQLPTF